MGGVEVLWGILLGGIAALFSYRMRLLTSSGAIAMFILAVPIFGYGGWAWTIPIIAFFIPSSLLSKVGKARKSQFNLIFEKSDQRDAGQVMANGGIAGIIAIYYAITGNTSAFPIYCAALAAASADTWATELGTLSKGTPRLITTCRQVPAGTSGGITLTGLIGASAGAFVVALSGWAFAGTMMTLAMVTASGLAGSLIDSFLGATTQAQYRCDACGKVTERREHCDQSTVQISGYAWMNNDWVNVLGIAGGAVLAWVII